MRPFSRPKSSPSARWPTSAQWPTSPFLLLKFDYLLRQQHSTADLQENRTAVDIVALPLRAEREVSRKSLLRDGLGTGLDEPRYFVELVTGTEQP